MPYVIRSALAVFILLAACSGGGNDFPEVPTDGSGSEQTTTTPADGGAADIPTAPAPAPAPPEEQTGTVQDPDAGVVLLPELPTDIVSEDGGGSGGADAGCDARTDECKPPKPPKPDCRTDDCKCRTDDCKRTAGDTLAAAPGYFELAAGAPEGVVPQIAGDANGGAVAVWLASDGVRRNLWANRYRDGAWGTPVLLEAEDGDIEGARLAMDAKSIAMVVWDQAGGEDRHIRAARYPVAGPPEAPVIISRRSPPDSPLPVRAFDAQIAAAEDGTVVATWQQFDEYPTSRVWTNRYTPETGWGEAAPMEQQ